MVNTSKKAVSLLLVVIFIMTAFVSVPVTTQAASYPTTHPNTYTNTGNGAVDITEIAKTQVGYQENSVGTKYGYWYNTVFVNQPWCAMFVSWCADQAGISQDVIKSFASCSVGVNWFKAQGVWHDSAYYGGTYVPKKGDIVFYRNSGSSNLSDHVGIVLGVNGSYIHCIEGNATNETCCEFKTNSARTLSNKYVIGYASPKYAGSVDSTENEPDKYENWQITDADVLMLRKSYDTSSGKVASMPFGTMLQVTEFQVTEKYLWGYTTYKEKSGWCVLDYCTYINGNIDGTYYQMPPQFTTETAEIYIQQKLKLKSKNTLTATYKSADKTIVKVNKNGKITGVSQGTAVITCVTPTGTDTCTVTVKNPTLKKKKLVTCIGETCAIELVGAYEAVTYTSENPEIATVDEKGVVTGVSQGEVKIIATTASGIELKCTVQVNKESNTYERFTVAKKKVYLKDAYEGKSIKHIPKGTLLKVTQVKYSDTYTWGETTYDNTAGWVVLNNCQYVDGNFAGTVYKAIPYLTVKKKTIYVDGTYTIVPYSVEGAVTYTSKKPEIATVDENGTVTALKAGTVNIIVKNGTTKLKCKIVVKNPTLKTTELHLLKGRKAALTVKGGSSLIQWMSSDEAVMTVSKNGVVKAISYGTATVTAIRNNIPMECTVNVYDPIISAETITVKKGKKKQLSISQNYSSEITWSSSNKKIAKVTKKGKITGVKNGTAIISAVVDGVTLECVVTVK